MFQVLAKCVRKEKEIEKICFETEIGILETRIITIITIVLKGESSRPI